MGKADSFIQAMMIYLLGRFKNTIISWSHRAQKIQLEETKAK